MGAKVLFPSSPVISLGLYSFFCCCLGMCSLLDAATAHAVSTHQNDLRPVDPCRQLVRIVSRLGVCLRRLKAFPSKCVPCSAAFLILYAVPYRCHCLVICSSVFALTRRAAAVLEHGANGDVGTGLELLCAASTLSGLKHEEPRVSLSPKQQYVAPRPSAALVCVV